jgi:hypothetical protein
MSPSYIITWQCKLLVISNEEGRYLIKHPQTCWAFPPHGGWFVTHQNQQNSPQVYCLCTVDLVLNPTVGVTSKKSTKHKKNPNFSPAQLWTSLVTQGRAEHTQHNLRDESKKKGEGGMPRFDGSEPICFKSVIGCSNVLRLAPNLVSLCYT